MRGHIGLTHVGGFEPRRLHHILAHARWILLLLLRQQRYRMNNGFRRARIVRNLVVHEIVRIKYRGTTQRHLALDLLAIFGDNKEGRLAEGFNDDLLLEPAHLLEAADTGDGYG